MSETYVVDSGDLRKYRIEIPNMVDDMGLSVHAFRLYAHIKRRAGASGGACWVSARELARHCGMGQATVSRAKKELDDAGLITIDPGDHTSRDVIRIADVWMENYTRYTNGGGVIQGGSGDPQGIRVIQGGSGRSTGDQGDPQGIRVIQGGSHKKEPSRSNHQRSNHQRNNHHHQGEHGKKLEMVDDDDGLDTLALDWILAQIERLKLKWRNPDYHLRRQSRENVLAVATWVYAYREGQAAEDLGGWNVDVYRDGESFIRRNGDHFAGVDNPPAWIISQAITGGANHPLTETDRAAMLEEIRAWGDDDLFGGGDA